MALHLALAHVAHASVELHGAVHDVFAGLHGGLLGLDGREDDLLARGIAAGDISGVDARDVDLASHVYERVTHDLA